MPPAATTAAQKQQIAEFVGVTQADSRTATKLLKQANWNVSHAVNLYVLKSPTSRSRPLLNLPLSFYSGGGGGGGVAPSGPQKSLNKIFDSYRTQPIEYPDELDIEATSKLCSDLQIDLGDIGALVFFEVIQSPQIGMIKRSEFVSALSEANYDSTTKIRNLVLSLRSQLPTNQPLFKRVYNHSFQLLLEDRKKAIELEQAEEFWAVLFSPAGFDWNSVGGAGQPWKDWWVEFLKEKWGRSINKDLWRQTLTFALETKKDPSLGFWNEESSWPSVIDDFVEWAKKEKGAGGGGEAMDVE